MASRTHHQLGPLQPLPDAALLYSGLTSCTCGASRPDDTTSASISTDTFTPSLDGWIRELKPPAKRRTVFVWQCCQCGQSNINIQLAACPECGISRCPYCPTMKVQIRPAGFARSEGEDIEGRSEAGLEEGTVYTCSGYSQVSMLLSEPPRDVYIRDENADNIHANL